MKNAGFVKSMLIAGMVASVALAADLFKDDFSNCAQTSQNWGLNYPDSMVATCGSGVYTIQNKQKGAAGFAGHTFAVKPSTLTASVSITRTGDSIAAGFFICLKTTAPFSGYAVQLSTDQSITVFKYGATTSQIYANFSSFLRAGAATNVIKITKSGTKLYLYANDNYLDVITDNAPLADGDFALLIPKNSTATFDNVLVTDQVPPDTVKNCVVDGFNDNSTFGWGDLDYLSTASEINNSVLSINSMNPGAYDYHYTDFKADTFSAKTILSFRKGRKGALYGFFFKGKEIGTRVPMAFFAINADKRYDAFIDTIGLPAIPNTIIHGPPYISGTDTTYFWDTLEVIKTQNSSYYKMLVNGFLIDSLSVTKANFPVNGVGVFCQDSLLVYVDTFAVIKDPNACPVITYVARNQRLLKRQQFNQGQSDYFVDPLGRKIYPLVYYSSSGKSRSLTPGFYFSKDGKSGVVLKKK